MMSVPVGMVVDLGAGVRRSGGVSPDQYVASSVLVIIYATAGLEEGNPLRVGVGFVVCFGWGSDDALRLETCTGGLARRPVGPINRRGAHRKGRQRKRGGGQSRQNFPCHGVA